MFSSKNVQMNERKKRSKVTRYAIKKLSVGTASVAVALGFMFVQGQTTVYADTVESTAVATQEAAKESPKKDSTEAEKAVKEATQKVEPTAETTTTTSQPKEENEKTTKETSEKEAALPDKAEETTAAAEVKEETTVAPENKPRTRSKRETPATSSDKIGDDVVDATSEPKVEKPGLTPQILADQVLKQVSWLDFGDTANWTGTTRTADGKLALQVGATYTKEVMPGYKVKLTIKSLRPFQATEIYRKRLESQGATTEEKATYDPNAKNGYISSTANPKGRAAYKAGEEAKVIAEAQNMWTEIRKEGIDTGNKKTVITSEFDGGNFGIQFEISGTYNGKPVKPSIVMADAESANPGELVTFTTNGTGWQHIGEWTKKGVPNTRTYVPQNTKDTFDPAKNYSGRKPVNVDGVNLPGQNAHQILNAEGVGSKGKTVAWKYFGSPDLKTGGLGTGVFGSNYSAGPFSVPLVMTRGASEVGIYVMAAGKQAAMIGFLPFDESDAPESYGRC